jgi:thiol-disulfide isomerase/thioredoxin
MPLRQTVLIVLVALAAAGLGLWLGQDRRPPPAAALPPGTEVLGVGDAAPAIELLNPDGHAVTVLPRTGRRVLINFWASWCPPCIKEMPLLDTFAAEQAAQDIDVIGIALEDAESVRSFLDQHPVAYQIAIAEVGLVDLSTRLGNARGVLPYSVLIDAQGRIAAIKLGEFRADELASWVGN